MLIRRIQRPAGWHPVIMPDHEQPRATAAAVVNDRRQQKHSYHAFSLQQ